MLRRALWALIAIIPAAAPAQPWEPDEHTLLLAHFDAGLDADHAVASPLAKGRSRLVVARFATGIHATKGWMTPEMTLLDLEAFPLFAPITYSAANLDPRTGCLEMMVWFEPVTNPEYFRRLMTYGNGPTYVFLALRPEPDRRTLLFHVEWGDGARVVSTDFPYDLNEQWHHIGMQWDAEHLGLIVDGEVVARRTNDQPGLPEPTSRISIGGHERGVNVTEGIIDEVRISAIPRYEH